MWTNVVMAVAYSESAGCTRDDLTTVTSEMPQVANVKAGIGVAWIRTADAQ